MQDYIRGTKMFKNQVKRLRRLYAKVAHVWHGTYLSRRLRRERRITVEDSSE
jgi:hypothetical protein